MAPKKVTTVIEAVFLLYQRMVEGKDRKRELTEVERESLIPDVPERVEQQNAGSLDAHFVRETDGTWWEVHPDWSHAMRWHLFNNNAVDPVDLRRLMDHFSRTIDKKWWATAPGKILIRESLGGEEHHKFTYEYLLGLQREGAFDGLRRHIVNERPHLADLFHEQTGAEIKMPARWFDKATDGQLNPERLSKARRDRRIEGDKRSGRIFYTVASVIAAYPEYASRLTATTTTNSDKLISAP